MPVPPAPSQDPFEPPTAPDLPMTHRHTHTPAILAILLAACGGGQGDEPSPSPTPATPPVATAPAVAIEEPPDTGDPVPDDKPGSVVGVALFPGTAPARAELEISGCEHAGASPALDNRTLIADGRLQNVYVTVKGLRVIDAPVPEEPVFLDQSGCMYSPRVIGLQVGQELRVRNSDPLNHNVHLYPRRATFPNNIQAPGAADFTFVFKRKEPAPVPIGCDIHPWMKSTVHLTDHPFFAVSDATGAFRIDGLPPGKHTLTAWHEVYGKLTAKLDLPPGGTARIEFTFAE